MNENAIDRKLVCAFIDGLISDDGEREKGLEYIRNMPPVTPQPKTGHWEWVQYDYNPKIGNWHCSECRSVVIECVDKNDKGGIPLYKYCPQCGARMVEPQESEDKDADKKCTYKETGCGSCKRQLNCPIEADTTESEDKA